LNLILFHPAEIGRPLPRQDPRAQHLLTVLRRRVGDTFDAGQIDGPRGKGMLLTIGTDNLEIRFHWEPAPPPPLEPVTLVIGLPRPQTARKILQEAAALGVQALHFVRTDKGEASYADSVLWSSGEWRRHLEHGAAQAFCTRIPALTHGNTLSGLLDTVPPPVHGIALDNYEAPEPLSKCHVLRDTGLLAFGPERGWSAEERAVLRGRGFAFAHLGTRVLRVETAVVAAVAIFKARRGVM
jgi:RsmE family RNA methyltransferase